MTGTPAVKPNLVVVAPTEIKMPSIATATKLIVWKTPDGVYHETIESARMSLIEKALADFLAINNITDVSTIPATIARYMDPIKQTVEAALRKIETPR